MLFSNSELETCTFLIQFAILHTLKNLEVHNRFLNKIPHINWKLAIADKPYFSLLWCDNGLFGFWRWRFAGITDFLDPQIGFGLLNISSECNFWAGKYLVFSFVSSSGGDNSSSSSVSAFFLHVYMYNLL